MREPDSHVVPHPEWWSCYDTEATEDEVVNLVVALVGAIKPRVSVEVGTYLGRTAALIGEAIRGYGHLHAFEAEPRLAHQAAERCEHLPVTIINDIDTNFNPASIAPVDFLFVDGALHNRGDSLAHWRPVLSPGALIAVHDSLKYPEVTEAVDEFDSVQRLDIVTPRGLTLMRCNVS